MAITYAKLMAATELARTCTCRPSCCIKVWSQAQFIGNRLITAKMKPGMTFTIEPVLLLEKPRNYFMWDDGWTGMNISGVIENSFIKRTECTVGTYYSDNRKWSRNFNSSFRRN